MLYSQIHIHSVLKECFMMAQIARYGRKGVPCLTIYKTATNEEIDTLLALQVSDAVTSTHRLTNGLDQANFIINHKQKSRRDLWRRLTFRKPLYIWWD